MTKRKSLPAQTRFSVLSRDRFTCRYCSRSAPEVELQIDHVKPVADGGSNELENLVTACADCNLGKSDKPVEFVPSATTGRAKGSAHHLIGCGFLSFKNGKCHEQGVIMAVFNTPEPAALLQYFEWIMGEETFQRLIPLKDILFDASGPEEGEITYRIFPTNDDRNSYYEWKSGKFEADAR